MGPKAGLVRVNFTPGFDVVTFVFVSTNGPHSGTPFDRYPKQSELEEIAAARGRETWTDDDVLDKAEELLAAEGIELDRTFREVRVDKPPVTPPPGGTVSVIP